MGNSLMLEIAQAIAWHTGRWNKGRTPNLLGDGQPKGTRFAHRISREIKEKMVTPAERGEPRNYKSLLQKVPNSAVIRKQWLTRHGSNFFRSTLTKKKVAGRVAALSDDKQKFNALSDYQNPRIPASSGWEVQS